ncbi:hypothetical protein EGW08_001466 [Elysia chlorotica]|uniref:Uncharacterized protein n=1 Tax=Elysia chlorotica TaxID=188477 RepID=A0A433UA73_ELYCH|nr:hypothetical protein EGW08_001466 [Elysia chlorotica]
MDAGVQENLYEDIKIVDRESSGQRKESPVQDVVNPKSRHRHQPGVVSGSGQSMGRGTFGREKSQSKNREDESSPKDDLLSPEERDMFIALGLAGERPNTDKNVTDLDNTATVEGRNSAELNIQPSATSGLKGNDHDPPETHENVKPSVKTKKTARPDLVSDILELSLQNIKGMKRGQGGDEAGGGGDGGVSEQDAVDLQEGQVQMSEC